MNEAKLNLLLELYEEYCKEDEIDIDLANQIIDQVPSLVKEIKQWKQAHVEYMSDKYENQF